MESFLESKFFMTASGLLLKITDSGKPKGVFGSERPPALERPGQLLALRRRGWRNNDIGRSEVILIDDETIDALNGSTGETLWQWPLPERFQEHGWPRPAAVCLADLDGDGRLHLCLPLLERNPLPPYRDRPVLASLDHRGKSREETLPTKPEQEVRLLAVDLTGNGRDEILFAERRKLSAYDGSGQHLWEQSLEHGGRIARIRIRPAAGDMPPMLLLGYFDGHDAFDSWCCLDGGTGRRLWEIRLPRTASAESIELLTVDPLGLPLRYMIRLRDGFAAVGYERPE